MIKEVTKEEGLITVLISMSSGVFRCFHYRGFYLKLKEQNGAPTFFSSSPHPHVMQLSCFDGWKRPIAHMLSLFSRITKPVSVLACHS